MNKIAIVYLILIFGASCNNKNVIVYSRDKMYIQKLNDIFLKINKSYGNNFLLELHKIKNSEIELVVNDSLSQKYNIIITAQKDTISPVKINKEIKNLMHSKDFNLLMILFKSSNFISISSYNSNNVFLATGLSGNISNMSEYTGVLVVNNSAFDKKRVIEKLDSNVYLYKEYLH